MALPLVEDVADEAATLLGQVLRAFSRMFLVDSPTAQANGFKEWIANPSAGTSANLRRTNSGQ
jgi:hypothetical protein